MLQGVFKTYKKDNTKYYRASITYQNKHISLGSFDEEQDANAAYNEAREVLYGEKQICDYDGAFHLDFKKWVVLINVRDNRMYIKTPIYLRENYFEYYLSQETALKFDVDDLFYYSNHSIMTRDGYLFVADYGMQVNILSRYGIKNHAVQGRDFVFANGDDTDYRYSNIIVINKYYGVERIEQNGRYLYRTKIHLFGDYIVGVYNDEIQAAVAYNKAADIVKAAGLQKFFSENYIEELSAIEYAKLYSAVAVSKKIRDFVTGT